MSKEIIILVLVLAVAGLFKFLRFAFLPARHLPRHRTRHLRLRLRLRLHPGRGHATKGELFLRWSRWSAFRESGRIRPSLTIMQRLRWPASHSTFIGRAHHRHGVRVPVQEHGAIVGPPRSFKSALMARIIMQAPGAVVCTSTKADLFELTSGVRAARGPIYVFNPQGVGGVPSNVRWSPLSGCREPAVAIRRGVAFATATSTAGAEDSAFWQREAGIGLQGLFAAAALAGSNMRRVGRWAGNSKETPEAVAVLHEAQRGEWAAKLAELNGPAEKTAQTIRTVMSSALSFLHDPALAETVLPAPGEEFSITDFLRTGGTLYMIARGDENDSTLAPLFASLATEIQFQATLIGSRMPGGRLDPPLTLALDELTQVCPVPAHKWLADSGGQGVSIWLACHGFSQLVDRYRAPGAQTIMDCSNVKVFLPGLADMDTLKMASALCGHATHSQRGGEGVTADEVMTPGMIRMLVPGHALVLRNGLSPVIVRLARGWKFRAYKRLRRAGLHIAPVIMPAAVPGDAIQGEAIPVPAGAIPVPVPVAAAPELDLALAELVEGPAPVMNGHHHPHGEQS